jgi:hypothetical protein
VCGRAERRRVRYGAVAPYGCPRKPRRQHLLPELPHGYFVFDQAGAWHGRWLEERRNELRDRSRWKRAARDGGDRAFDAELVERVQRQHAGAAEFQECASGDHCPRLSLFDARRDSEGTLHSERSHAGRAGIRMFYVVVGAAGQHKLSRGIGEAATRP